MKEHNLYRGKMLRFLFLPALLLLCAFTTAFVVTAHGPPQTENEGNDVDNSKQFGSIKGVVTFEGDVPQARIADNSGQRRDLLTVDRKTRGLKYAIAYLDDSSPAAEGNQTQDVPRKPVTIGQKDHTFLPHLVAIRSGQSVVFTNSDIANHNVRSSTLLEKNQFNVITEAGGEYQHQFSTDRKVRPVLLTCDIHPWMNAWIYIFDHPYYAVTDEQGRFEITAIEPGKHRLIIRQPDGGYHQELVVDIHAGHSSEVEIRVTREALKGF